METFAEHYQSMMDTIQRCMPGADLEIIDRAVEFAREKHKNQVRRDGSPYIIHPLAVAEIVAEIGLDTANRQVHLRHFPCRRIGILTID